MVGLERLVTKLRSMNKVKVNHRIYCSMISKAFIVRRYPYLDERWVRDLFPNEPLTIHVFDRQKGGSMYQLRVIAIPANHCPGSVMCVMDFYHEIPVGHYVIYTVMSFSGFASRH